MTKAEIENLIEYLQANLPKFVFDERFHDGDKIVEKGAKIYCPVAELFRILREEYPVEEEKACEPDWKAMHMRNAEEMDKMCVQLESMRKDMHNLSIEHARYVGAVAAMETIFGRKFDPQR